MKYGRYLTTTKSVRRPLMAGLASVVIGLTVIGLSGCDSANGKVQPQAAAEAGAPVSAAIVVDQQIVETQEFSGRMEAIEHVEIRSRVSGFITSVNFKPGSKVKKGQVLFVIDPRPFQTELRRAEATAVSARAKADLAKLELSRAAKLFGEKAIAQREFDESSSGSKELEANASAAQAQYETAKLNLGYTQVVAPIDGRVSKAEITTGNLIDSSTILTSVVSDQSIYASFDGDEDTYLRVGAQVRNNQPIAVRVGLANETGFPHEGKLEFVDNQLDPRTGAVRMRATFPNTDNTLSPGLFARVQLDTGNGTNAQTKAILINDRAVGTDQSRKFVFVVGPNNKAEYRLVTLGKTFDGLRIVRSGLKPNEKIVVNGLQRVRPDAQLAPKIVAMNFDVVKVNPEKDSASDSAAKDVKAKD